MSDHIEAAADARGLLRLTAPVELIAAAGEGKRPTFRMTAYTGGALALGGWYSPVVVDLATARAAASLPILRDHDAGRIVGHAETITITAKAITAEGVISGVGIDADEVIASSKNGFPWQASIGAQPGRLERVEAGAKVTVNGQSFNGPVLVARDTTLREISFVAIGADGNTSAAVAASDRGVGMTFEQWLQARGFDPATITDQQRAALLASYNAEQNGGNDAVQAERQRIGRIDAICRGPWGEQARHVEQLRQQAITGTITFESLQSELLTILRASRATTPAATTGVGPDRGQLLAASLLVSQGCRTDFVAAHYGQQITDAALSRPNRGMSIQGLLRQIIAAAGGHAPSGRFTDSSIRTAFEADRSLRASGFSTMSLPGLLSNVASKLLLESFQAASTTWSKFCKKGSNPDFKAAGRYRLTGAGQFEEVSKGGELAHISLTDAEYTAQLATFGAMIALTRQDIINDDLGALATVPRILGRMSAVRVEKSVYELLIANAGDFFGTSNGNYISGATTALAAEGLRQGFQKFIEQTDANGDPLLLAPKVLLVPPALQATALALANSHTIVMSGGNDATTLPSGNVWAGQFEPTVSPFLAASAGHGGVDTNWYLLAGPGDYSIIEVAFLNGAESPTIEDADTDFSTLGMQFRAYHDFGVNVLDHRGGIKSKGAA